MNYLLNILQDITLFKEVRQIFVTLDKQCADDKFNLLLHRHLGDNFYCLASLEEFKRKWGEEPRVFLPRQYLFLRYFYQIEDAIAFDLTGELKKIKKFQSLSNKELDILENEVANFFCYAFPLKSKLFVCSGDKIFPFKSYQNYWCFRWGENLLLGSHYKFSLPKLDQIELKAITKTKLVNLGIRNLSKTVLIAPEAKTTEIFGTEFWNLFVEELSQMGFKIIVNSDSFKLKNSILLPSQIFSLEEIVEIAYHCRYVLSIRSGLCDTLVNKSRSLIVFYPSCLRREYGGLSYPFQGETEVNEIQFINWKSGSLLINGIDFGIKIHKFLRKRRIEFWITLLLEMLTFGAKKFKIKRLIINNLYGNGNGYPDNNRENPRPYLLLLKKIRIYKNKYV